MKLKVLLFFGKLIYCQFPVFDYEPEPEPEKIQKLIGEIIGYHQNNKNFDTKVTPESSYRISRYVFLLIVFINLFSLTVTHFDSFYRCGLLPNFKEKLNNYYKEADLENINGETRPYDKNCITARVARRSVF